MSEDNAYTKLAQIVLGTFIEQVADLVRARINTSFSVTEEMIQGMVCAAFKREFDAAMKDTFNRRIDSAIDGIDIEDMIEQAIESNISSPYIKRVIADIMEERMPDKSTSEIGAMNDQLGNMNVELSNLRSSIMDANIKLQQLQNEIGINNPQLGNLERQIAGLRRDMDKIVQACMSIGVSSL